MGKHDGRRAGRAIAAAAALAVAAICSSCLFAGKPGIEVKSPNGTIMPGQYYDFGSEVAVGSTSSAAFTIVNTGGSRLTVRSIALGNGLFGCDLADMSFGLDPDESKTCTFTFSPEAAGNAESAVTISSDAEEGTFSFNLKGAGKVPLTLEPLSPPSWIQGMWWQSGGTATNRNQYSFSADDVVFSVFASGSETTRIDFKSWNKTYFDNGQADTGYYDSETDADTYLVESKASGAVVGTWVFDRLSASSMNLTVTGASAGGPYLFNKQ